jgi:hypothetical protein
MSIRRTAPSSSGSSGSGGGFWTALAAWAGLAVSLANLALIMYLWNRLPVDDLRETLGSALHRDRSARTADAGGAAPPPLAVEDKAPAQVERPAERDSAAVARPDQATREAGAPTGEPRPSPEAARPGIRLQVQNGTGVRLKAAEAADGLRRLRYDVRETGNAPEDLDKTRIISRVEDPAPSLRLAQDLGLSSARISYSEDPALVDIDVTLILGADYRKLPIMGKR